MPSHELTPSLWDEDAAAPAAGEAGAAMSMDALLQAATEAGALRRLDLALARFITELDPTASPVLPLLGAWLAQAEGRGHSCLMLAPLWAASAPANSGDAPSPETQAARWLRELAWPAETQALLTQVAAQVPLRPADWLAALRASPALRDVDTQADTGQPLVLAGAHSAQPRLYWRRYWLHEQQVASQLRTRSQPLSPHDPDAVPEARLRHWLDQLFPATDATTGPQWQKLACAVALRGRLGVITGGPGTGKTYTAARLLALLLATSPAPERLRVALAAPTGKAAARLKQAIDQSLQHLQTSLRTQTTEAAPDLVAFTERMGAARTLHALLGARPDTRALRHHAGAPLDVDVLIVDEASMIHLEMMAGLLAALPPQARLILLGDKDQLASVEAGAVLGDLCRDAERGAYGQATQAFALAAAGVSLPVAMTQAEPAPPLAQLTVMLRESRRFQGEIGELARAVNQGSVPDVRRVLREATGAVLSLEGVPPTDVLRLALQGRPGAEGGYRDYLSLVQAGLRPGALAQATAHRDWVLAVLQAFDRFRVLCAVREGDWGASGLNRAIAQALAQAGWLRTGAGEWYAGRPVMITRNDPALGVFNGDIGMALPGPGGSALRVWMADGPQLRSVAVGRLAHLETAFAMTVHKSQGSEFAHTVLVLPDQAGSLLSRELVYTGITRARSAFTLVAARPHALDQAVAQPTRRASGLVAALQA